MNEKIFESTKLVQPLATPDSWQSLCYVGVWDAFLAQSIQEWSEVFRDGTKVKFGKPSGSYIMLGRVKGFPAYYSVSTYKIYSAYEINGLPNPNEVLNPAWDIVSPYHPSAGSGRFVDDINQVYLHQPDNDQIDIYNLGTGVKSGEIVHNIGETFSSLAWVQQGQVAGLCPISGQVRIMDYLNSTPTVVSTHLIDPFKVAAYDCIYKLFFTIGTDHKTRVYTQENLPYSLSAPVFQSVTVDGLRGTQVKVRLTDQSGNPVSGWWVNWALESVGVGIIGVLSKSVSETDADGYASNLYIGPDDGSTGQCKIKASVVL